MKSWHLYKCDRYVRDNLKNMFFHKILSRPLFFYDLILLRISDFSKIRYIIYIKNKNIMIITINRVISKS